MANVIPFKELAKLPRGTHVWEECRWGEMISEIVKTKAATKGGRLRIWGRFPGTSSDLRLADEDDFRYWDAKPSDEERQETPWKAW